MRDCIARVDDVVLAQKLQDAVAALPEVTAVYTRYCSSNMFGGAGEQLAARQGFFNMSATRAAFQGLMKNSSLACEDIFCALSMRFVTIDIFIDYCTVGRRPLSYDKRDEDIRRAFVSDMERICYTLDCFSKKAEAGLFLPSTTAPTSTCAECFRALLPAGLMVGLGTGRRLGCSTKLKPILETDTGEWMGGWMDG